MNVVSRRKCREDAEKVRQHNVCILADLRIPGEHVTNGVYAKIDDVTRVTQSRRSSMPRQLRIIKKTAISFCSSCLAIDWLTNEYFPQEPLWWRRHTNPLVGEFHQPYHLSAGARSTAPQINKVKLNSAPLIT